MFLFVFSDKIMETVQYSIYGIDHVVSHPLIESAKSSDNTELKQNKKWLCTSMIPT
jgi:hypothetical protein